MITSYTIKFKILSYQHVLLYYQGTPLIELLCKVKTKRQKYKNWINQLDRKFDNSIGWLIYKMIGIAIHREITVTKTFFFFKKKTVLFVQRYFCQKVVTKFLKNLEPKIGIFFKKIYFIFKN